MLTELLHIDPNDLTPHPQNSRLHDPAQLAELGASIRRFGIPRSVIIDEDRVILAGHGVTQAAILEGLPTVPTIMVVGLTDAQKRAYLIADNRLSERSTWDWTALAKELSEIEADVDLATIGFPDWSFDALGLETKTKDDDSDDELLKCPRCGHEHQLATE